VNKIEAFTLLKITPVPPRQKNHQERFSGNGLPAMLVPEVVKMKLLL
jgi:hypothetical protein